jgi:hypothetical protein
MATLFAIEQRRRLLVLADTEAQVLAALESGDLDPDQTENPRVSVLVEVENQELSAADLKARGIPDLRYPKADPPAGEPIVVLWSTRPGEGWRKVSAPPLSHAQKFGYSRDRETHLTDGRMERLFDQGVDPNKRTTMPVSELEARVRGGEPVRIHSVFRPLTIVSVKRFTTIVEAQAKEPFTFNRLWLPVTDKVRLAGPLPSQPGTTDRPS